ncbi:MAG: polyprenyl synthetase family protein [SAR324 cluster bacterium]|nr:polyprenyl synthetase family protein [SAR324 cluster bacterium]
MSLDQFSAAQYRFLKDYLQQAGSFIQQEISNRIPLREPREYLYDLMHDYPSRGGKKFRSALVLLSCELFGGKPQDALLTATAFELFQNFALIHDDIEDDSMTRRGKPTLHRLHGIPLALNAGDCMLGLVFETLMDNESRLGTATTMNLIRHFNQVIRYTFEGQAMDIGWVSHDKFPTREEYQQMITRKTGWYSGRGPCECGALLAGASDEDISWIGRFGESIGIGFQARDDVLNLIADSEHQAPSAHSGGYGKEQGGDFEEGKRTLITIEMFERLSSSEAETLHEILLKPREKNSPEEIEWAIERAIKTGSIDAVRNYCESHAEQAYDCLKHLPATPARSLMEELVSFLTIKREN